MPAIGADSLRITRLGNIAPPVEPHRHPWADYRALRDRHGNRVAMDRSGTLIPMPKREDMAAEVRIQMPWKVICQGRSIAFDKSYWAIMVHHMLNTFFWWGSGILREKLNACDAKVS